jgi:hypothetical protein
MRLTLFFAAALACFAADSSKTFTGVITDSMCGADHKMMGVTPDAKCVRDCVKGGSQYALIVGKEVYTLNDAKAADKYAAQKVKVTGTLDEKNKTIQVQSIAAAK